MKSLLSIIFLASVALAQLNAQTLDDLRTQSRIVTWRASELPNYSIQVLATKQVPEDASFVKGSDVIYEFKTNDGYLKYFFGSYASFAAANKELQKVRDMGYEGAFVANMKKIANAKTASSSNSNVVTTGNKPIEIDPNKDYVVQVGAYRFPLYVSFFDNLGKVIEYRLNDKIFRYTTQPIKGSQVESELSRVKSLGYDNAFVVEYASYSPYRIE